jgi:predicted nuclease of predicted toxin-antitoxin system
MNIFVDENIPLITVEQLREMGHDILDIRGTDNQGMTDEALWNISCQQKRLLITTDRGFSNYRQKEHHGILIVSLRQPNRQKIHQRIMEALKTFTPDKWPGLLVVMRDKTMSTWQPKKDK